ncbi:hypothetical protein EV361DRAFT_519628 [Lentinula raphanica]|nr:hypothetical protein EV361DRAFT_519628 [Lentinula raphanica]
MKHYQPLWSARNFDEFKKVFVDLVECHHLAYKKGEYLHRDISETNLMIDRDEDGAAMGVLRDWGLSSTVNSEGVVTSSNVTHRTGTYPFLAMGLLRDNPPAHLYCHDLESFFYILIWAGLHYSFDDKNSNYYVKEEVKSWMDSRRQSWNARSSKELVFLLEEYANPLFKQFHPDFKPLVEQWVRPLWRLFRCALLKANSQWHDLTHASDFSSHKSRNTAAAHYFNVTLDETLTFENFMQAIRENPRQWD